MTVGLSRHAAAFAVGLFATASPFAAFAAEQTHDHDQHADHAHAHGEHDRDAQVHKGYFKDSQVKARTLEDWQGDWQSVYPLLEDGTLDKVFSHKAHAGDKSAAEYKSYYRTGYRTDVERIEIDGQDVTFHANGEAYSGHYVDDGHEILTYKAGNRGVRYIFEKASGDVEAPKYIQFSDHDIAPTDAGHYHLYMGNDRQALLDNVTNWPTYYPAGLSGEQVAQEMMAH